MLQVPLVLAVEVVSPGKKAKARDYNEKPQEYAQKGIPEYWIVDPNPGKQKVTVLRLVDGSYQVAEFRGIDRIISQALPELNLTAKSILEAKS